MSQPGKLAEKMRNRARKPVSQPVCFLQCAVCPCVSGPRGRRRRPPRTGRPPPDGRAARCSERRSSRRQTAVTAVSPAAVPAVPANEAPYQSRATGTRKQLNAAHRTRSVTPSRAGAAGPGRAGAREMRGVGSAGRYGPDTGAPWGGGHGDQRPRGASVTTGYTQLNPVRTACTAQQPLRYGRPLGHAPVNPVAGAARDLAKEACRRTLGGMGLGRPFPDTAPPHSVVPHRG